jgi:RsmE family RNA methyltransferase
MNKHIFSFYYYPKVSSNTFNIHSDESLYQRIINILRMNEGDTFYCFDDSNLYYVGIKNIHKKFIHNMIITQESIKKKSKKIYAYVPFLDREYLNTACYILGQQGVTEIRLIKTDYTQIKEYSEKDYIRFRKLIVQGCEEGRQYVIPTLVPSLKKISDLVCEEPCLYWFYEKGIPLGDNIENINNKDDISFICGPERGFSIEEITLLSKYQSKNSIKLSQSTLRSVDVIYFASIFFSAMNE